MGSWTILTYSDYSSIIEVIEALNLFSMTASRTPRFGGEAMMPGIRWRRVRPDTQGSHGLPIRVPILVHPNHPGIGKCPILEYWTSPYSSHYRPYTDHGWVMWNMGTWLMTHVIRDGDFLPRWANCKMPSPFCSSDAWLSMGFLTIPVGFLWDSWLGGLFGLWHPHSTVLTPLKPSMYINGYVNDCECHHTDPIIPYPTTIPSWGVTQNAGTDAKLSEIQMMFRKVIGSGVWGFVMKCGWVKKNVRPCDAMG